LVADNTGCGLMSAREQKSDSMPNATLVVETVWKSCGMAVPLTLSVRPTFKL
jgi:hypothetical protein